MMAARGGAADAPLLRVSGEIHGADVSRFFDEAVASAWAGGQRVVLDLSDVNHWSILAQAMVLGLARELAHRRCSLELVGAGLGLRLQSQRLDVFTKVRALARQGDPWSVRT